MVIDSVCDTYYNVNGDCRIGREVYNTYILLLNSLKYIN